MSRVICVAALAASVAAGGGAGAAPRGPAFPLDRTFMAVAMNNTKVRSNHPTLTIKRSGGAYTAQGFGGCNQWNGTVVLDGAKLEIRDSKSTMMGCADMAIEQEFFAAIAKVRNWRMDGEALVLEGGGASVRLLPTTRR